VPLFVEGGRLIVSGERKSRHRGSSNKQSTNSQRVLVQCAIPGCGEPPMSEAEFEGHLLFHEDPVEQEPETLSADADDEGVYSVTSVGEEDDGRW